LLISVFVICFFLFEIATSCLVHFLLFPHWKGDQALRLIQNTAAKCGWPKGFKYDVHSLRVGGVQHLERQGVNPEEIRILGRWSAESQAFRCYRSRLVFEVEVEGGDEHEGEKEEEEEEEPQYQQTNKWDIEALKRSMKKEVEVKTDFNLEELKKSLANQKK